MIDKLHTKAGTWVNWYAGRNFRIKHPVQAAILDSAVLATWTCWSIALAIVTYYILSGNAAALLGVKR